MEKEYSKYVPVEFQGSIAGPWISGWLGLARIEY